MIHVLVIPFAKKKHKQDELGWIHLQLTIMRNRKIFQQNNVQRSKVEANRESNILNGN
jgi:hypothetical protein